MSDRSDELQDHHNKGQQDASEGKYDQPHEVEEMLFSRKIAEKFEDNDAYREGWRNTKDQKDNSSGGCYITTACVEHAGLADNCSEMMVLRQFRDGYLTQRLGGLSLIREYYQVAPSIVARIQQSKRRADVLEGILSEVRAVAALIQTGHNESALTRYGEMFTRLKREFIES